ncbi:thioredoxin-like domain-containing protein [Sphingobacterium sp. Mn56C]|uniref:thioredoxin-like domain-containing protein n=1 Tax=Sphingobacterium sp. Mn56C TaxID=3395261 RepID=UPI003BC1C678
MDVYKLIVCIGLLGVSFMGLAQNRSFSIQGNFPQWSRGAVVLLYRQNNALTADTCELLQGKFRFRGRLDQPAELSLYSIASVAGTTKDNMRFYVDKGTVRLNGTDSLATATLTGGRFTQQGLALKNATDPLMQQIADLRKRAAQLRKVETRPQDFAEIDSQYRCLLEDLKRVKLSFIKSHPKSFLSLLTLNEYLSGAVDYTFAAPLFNSLDPKVQNTALGKQTLMKLTIAKNTGIGAILPDFTVKDTLGMDLSLLEVVRSGKVTLLDFWASWCLPCRKENPNLVKAYQAFHDRGFNILSVSLDKSAAAWKKAIQDDKLTWFHVSSLQYWEEPVVKQFGISGVPDSFLLDGNGKVIARGLRGEALFEKLKALFM